MGYRKDRFLFFLILISFVSIAKNRKPKAAKTLANWSIGVRGSYDYTYRWLYDNPRYIDSTSGITDKDLIKYRNKYDRPRWGRTAGILFEKHLDPGNIYSIQTGFIISDIGEKVKRSSVTEADFKQLLAGSKGDPIVNHYYSLEIPVALKFKRTPDLNFFTHGRDLFGMAGVSVGAVLLPLSSYKSNPPNILLKPMAGLGISQQFLSRFTFSIAAVARVSPISLFKYTPINSHYYSLGGEAQLTFRPAKSKKKKKEGAITCFFQEKKVKKKKPNNTLHGFIYGLNGAFTKGSDVTSAATGIFGIANPPSGYTLLKAEKHLLYAPHIGFHSERTLFKKLLKNRIALITELIYSRKGFRVNFEYSSVSSPLGNRLKTTAHVRINYLDVPIMLRANIAGGLYVFGGCQLALSLGGRKISTYYQYFNNASMDTISGSYGYRNVSFNNYFNNSPTIFLKGWVGGIGYSIDERVDINIRVQKTNEIVSTGDFYNITGQLSLIYLFKKR